MKRFQRDARMWYARHKAALPLVALIYVLFALILHAAEARADFFVTVKRESTPEEVWQARWEALCDAHDVNPCPRLRVSLTPIRGFMNGYTQCGHGQVRRVRLCQVEIFRKAEEISLLHEMAHVLQWLGGDKDLDHKSVLFRRAYSDVTGKLYRGL